MVSHRVAIATEGPSSEAVLRVICRRMNVVARIASSQGKDKLKSEFPKIFRAVGRDADRYLVVPDLHPEKDCRTEVAVWKTLIDMPFPSARLCLAIWETESWLVADPSAVKRSLNFEFHVTDPESVSGDPPSRVLEREFNRARGYKGGLGFDKHADGARIATEIDFEVARRRSASLDRLIRLIGS